MFNCRVPTHNCGSSGGKLGPRTTAATSRSRSCSWSARLGSCRDTGFCFWIAGQRLAFLFTDTGVKQTGIDPTNKSPNDSFQVTFEVTQKCFLFFGSPFRIPLRGTVKNVILKSCINKAKYGYISL